jgi:hypothetical protein
MIYLSINAAAMEKITRKSIFRGGLKGQSQKATTVQFSERSGGTKPESYGNTTFGGGLEGLCPSNCAAGATPST